MVNFNTSLIQWLTYGLFSLLLAVSCSPAFSQEIASDSVLSLSLVYAPSKYPIAVRQRASIDSSPIVYLNSVDTVVLLDYTGGNYYRVCLPEDEDRLGYVSLDYLAYDQTAVTRVNTYNETHGKTRRLKYTAPPKGYEKQQTNEYNKAQLYNSSHPYTTPDSRTIHTGPRGGRYYINSNGNKTYVKH